MRPIFAIACLCLTVLAGCKSDGGGDAGNGGGGGGGTPPGPAQPDAPENTATAACDFGIADIPANGSRTFDCVLDLGGDTFAVASGASLRFDKGDIRNGTLQFNGGTIDGRLMNSSLTVTGNVDLASETFDFYPERWDVRQGRVNATVALSNRDALEAIIAQSHRMRAKIFRINRMDAYFNVTPVADDDSFRPEDEAVNVPFSFTLQMTENTHMRVQPNGHRTYALLASTDTYASFIRGGNLYGDRSEHTYTAGSTHEWGYLVYLFGVQGGGVYDATLRNATGDAIKVQARPDARVMSFFQAGRNIFDGNRRNHISVTSCVRVTIFDNTFRNASTGGSGASAGVGPGMAVDLSASRTQNPDGSFIEKVSIVRMFGNTETNSRGGSFAVTHAEDVEIYDNDVSSGMSYAWAKDTLIRNNDIIAPSPNSGVGLQIGQIDAADATVSGNVVARNTVSGFATGIQVSGHNAEVIRNTVIQAAQGLVVDQLSDSNILGTIINSTRAQSVGILAENTALQNVNVDGSVVLVASHPIRLTQVNNGAGQGGNNLNILNNSLRSDVISLLDRVTGVDFDGNQLSSGLELRGVVDTSLVGNNIRTDNDNGIHLQQTNTGITIRDSRINVASDKECIVIDASTSAGEVTQQSNVCDQEIDYPRPGIAISDLPYPEIPDTTYTIDLAFWDIPANRTDPIKTNQNLQAAVDWASEEGYGTVRFPAGHFLIGEFGNDIYYSGLKLYGNTAYLLDANTIIEMTANDKWNYCLLEVRNVQNVVISGGQLRGDKDEHTFTPTSSGSTAHDEGHLICLEGQATENITIHSTIMRDATGDGVLMVGGRDGAPSVNEVDIINNDIGYNRRQGISLVGATNVRIEDNEIHHINGTSPQFGIDFEGPGRTNRNAEIRNNYFHHNKGGDIVNTDGRNVLIENNVLEQGAGSTYIDGPLVYWKKGDMTVRYNEITMTSMSVNNWNGIIMYSSNTPKTNPATTYIYENVCNGCGMYMYYGADLEIRDNLMYNGHIALKDFTNVTITNNRVIRSRAYCWPYRFLRVRGQASGNILDDRPFDIPLSTTSDYSDCWI